MVQLLCLILLAVSLSPVYLARDKPGKCPAIEDGAGLCKLLCNSDEGCNGSKKCCFNGCSYTCEIPECESGQNGTCGGIQTLSCTNGTTCMFKPKDYVNGEGKCCNNSPNDQDSAFRKL